MPVRFLSPSLGGYSGPLKAHGWEIGVAYRHLGADQWFVGSDVRESAAPFGQPLLLGINSMDVSVSYGVTDRAGVTLTLPFARVRIRVCTPMVTVTPCKRQVSVT